MKYIYLFYKTGFNEGTFRLENLSLDLIDTYSCPKISVIIWFPRSQKVQFNFDQIYKKILVLIIYN